MDSRLGRQAVADFTRFGSNMDGNRVDSSEMLKELRIDRSGGGSSEPRSRGPLIAIIVGALAVGGVGAWALLGRGNAIEVRTALAQPVITANTAGDSVLDASGYVTARRQATVSSKVTGRVLEVLIEEGQKVEEGQVLARLDPIDVKA